MMYSDSSLPKIGSRPFWFSDRELEIVYGDGIANTDILPVSKRVVTR